MQLDLDGVRKVAAGLIDQHVLAGHEKQAVRGFEKEPAGVGHRLARGDGGQPRGGEQQWLDHAFPPVQPRSRPGSGRGIAVPGCDPVTGVGYQRRE